MSKRRKFKWSWRRVISLGLAVLLICGAVAGVSALVDYTEDEKKTISPGFKIGGLSDEGIATDNEGALYTPEAFKADGLEINLDFDSHLSYQVYFYTPDGIYVECSEIFTKSGKPYVAPGLYARVVLYPIWGQLDDEDMEISWYEVWGYTSDIEIRVSKDSKKAQLPGFERIELTDGFFVKNEGFNEGSGLNLCAFEHLNEASPIVDAIYFGESATATQKLSKMSVALIVDQSYYYNGDEISGYPKAGNIPTKDNPLYIFEGANIRFVVNNEITDYKDVVAYIHVDPNSSFD